MGGRPNLNKKSPFLSRYKLKKLDIFPPDFVLVFTNHLYVIDLDGNSVESNNSFSNLNGLFDEINFSESETGDYAKNSFNFR